MVLKRTPRIALVSLFLFNPLQGEEKIDFAREVLPILSDKCFACHGPDTKKAKDLRLDSYKAATKDRKGIRSIDPDNLEDSEIIFRIHDKDDPMPPEDD
ncbi:MAG: c-type cytochrome domain-containing protein, partial [Akkermansiaceae bacterium]